VRDPLCRPRPPRATIASIDTSLEDGAIHMSDLDQRTNALDRGQARVLIATRAPAANEAATP
jgi:hypothetical protein